MTKQTNCLCPECGHKLTISTNSNQLIPVRPQAYRRQTMNSTSNPLQTTEQPTGDFYKMTPIAKLEPIDIFTSLLDAGASFILISIGGEIIGYKVGWPIATGSSIGFVVALWRYFGGMAAAQNLLSIVEEWTTKEEHIPHPQKEEHTIKVEVQEGKQWKFANLPGKQKNLIKMAQAINLEKPLNKPFAERTALKYGLSRSQFQELRDIFVTRGWAEWNHPTQKQQGISLTRSGKTIIRHIAISENTPVRTHAVARTKL